MPFDAAFPTRRRTDRITHGIQLSLPTAARPRRTAPAASPVEQRPRWSRRSNRRRRRGLGRRPDAFRRTERRENHRGSPRNERGNHVDEPRPVIVRHEKLRHGERHARDEQRRPHLEHPAPARVRRDQPERNDHREDGAAVGRHRAESAQLADARHRPGSAMTGVPSAPNATGAVFAISDERRTPRAARSRARSGSPPVTATGVPKPAAPSKNAPKQNATEQKLKPPIVGDAPVIDRCRARNTPRSVGQTVQEDDVEHDPADREEPDATPSRPPRPPSRPACRTRIPRRESRRRRPPAPRRVRRT